MLFLVFLFAFAVAQPKWCSPSDYANSSLPEGFCARLWATGLARPRGIWTASNGDLLVVESQTNSITALYDTNNDGFSDSSERTTLVGHHAGLNHGIVVHGDYLYATSASTLFRWHYIPSQRRVGNVEVVIRDIPSTGHTTRTPRFDKDGLLYLSLGSAANIDNNSQHARVNRFDITKSLPIAWTSGFVYADGLRNEVGLNFDAQGRLWGVMNGMDDLRRNDLGGDIHNTNPAEELNLLATPGKFYGYPYCWAEYNLPTYGKGAGTMWAHENFVKDGTHTDAWCQNPNNVEKPTLALSPHTAPLDVFFWNGDSFGSEFKGDAFVSLHGSWNRQPPAGYRVVRIEFEDGVPKKETPFLWHNGAAEKWGNNFRPVGLAWTPKNCDGKDCLFVSSDGTGEIVFIRKV